MLFPYCLRVGYELCSLHHTAFCDPRGVVTDLCGTGFVSSAMHVCGLVLYRQNKDKQLKLALLRPKFICLLYIQILSPYLTENEMCLP